jgi:hypothetical protein
VIEVSQRNSNEDIQRTCFRTFVYRSFLKTPVKTIIIIPDFTSPRSSRLFMFLLNFSDMFLFSEDLGKLGKMIDDPNYFAEYLFAKLGAIYPESETLLKALRDRNEIVTHEELCKATGIATSKIKRLFYQNHVSFKTMGIVEKFGNYCRLNPRFLQRSL